MATYSEQLAAIAVAADGQVATLESEVASLQAQISDATSQLASAKLEIDAAAAASAAALDSVNARLQASQGQVADLTAKLAAAQSQPAGAPPRLITGNPVITTDLDNVIFTGRPLVGKPGLRWTNITWDFTEPVPTNGLKSSLLNYVDGMRGFGGLVLENALMMGHAREGGWWVDAFENLGNITLIDVDISGVVDGLHFAFPTKPGENSLVRNVSYHNGASYANIPLSAGYGQSDHTSHGDAAQFAAGGGDVLIDGFTASGYSNAALMIAQGTIAKVDQGSLTFGKIEIRNFHFGPNLAGSKGAAINLAVSNGNDLRSVNIHDGVIEDRLRKTYEILSPAGVNATLKAIKHADGSPAVRWQDGKTSALVTA